jgi:hypothetical protein
MYITATSINVECALLELTHHLACTFRVPPADASLPPLSTDNDHLPLLRSHVLHIRLNNTNNLHFPRPSWQDFSLHCVSSTRFGRGKIPFENRQPELRRAKGCQGLLSRGGARERDRRLNEFVFLRQFTVFYPEFHHRTLELIV